LEPVAWSFPRSCSNRHDAALSVFAGLLRPTGGAVGCVAGLFPLVTYIIRSNAVRQSDRGLTKSFCLYSAASLAVAEPDQRRRRRAWPSDTRRVSGLRVLITVVDESSRGLIVSEFGKIPSKIPTTGVRLILAFPRDRRRVEIFLRHLQGVFFS
jgi:hypothetical protein